MICQRFCSPRGRPRRNAPIRSIAFEPPAIDGFFAKLTRQRLKRGVFKGIVDLQTAINRYLAETNDYRRAPLTTKSASRSPQTEHRNRVAHSITVIVDP